ncbi:hypothetical protein MGN70_014305 [Eutypa lata]|nr:hypothetical protein MGN70_014305 [Eutypa lata]
MAAASASRVMRTGKKQVFLPDHMITFLRPKDTTNQPPNFATFKVPLTFNKLDLRDYLRHAYDVATLGVRSQLRQQRPRRSRLRGGRVYRPPPIKTMTVELAKPFVWPEAPEDKTPWVSERQARSQETPEKREARQRLMQKTGKMPLRDEMKMPKGRVSLQEEAKRLLKEGRWSNGRALDPKFADGKAGRVGKDAAAVGAKTRDSDVD